MQAYCWFSLVVAFGSNAFALMASSTKPAGKLQSLSAPKLLINDNG
jgi:hypothetical protein